MVTDFKHLNWFKKWLDDTLDHKFIIDKSDPMFNHILSNGATFDLIYTQTPFKKASSFSVINMIAMRKTFPNCKEEMFEYLESFVVVNFVPTSENLSKWIFDIVQEKMSEINIKVSQVQFFETPKSQSNYFI